MGVCVIEYAINLAWLDAIGRETATLCARENGLLSPASGGDEDCVARKNHGASFCWLDLDISSKQEPVRGRARHLERQVHNGMKIPAGKKHGASDAFISSKTESMLLMYCLCAKNCPPPGMTP